MQAAAIWVVITGYCCSAAPVEPIQAIFQEARSARNLSKAVILLGMKAQQLL
jgi:hypothetical protein